MTTPRDGSSGSGGLDAVPSGHPAETPPGSGPSAHLSFEDTADEIEATEQEYRPPAAGPVTNAVVAAVVVLFGVAALIGSWRLGLGSARTPDAGLWPLLVSVVLVVLALVLLATFRRTADTERFSPASGLVLGGLATMVVFVAVIQYVGFEVPAVLLCFVWLRFLGREGWRMSIAGSLGVVVAFYVIFVAALSVPIPHLF
jgi:hypothetical protein